MDKYGIHRVLVDNPSWAETMREALEWENAEEQKIAEDNANKGANDFQRSFIGWEWHDVHTAAVTLNKMVTAGLLDVKMSTRSSTRFALRDRQATKEALELLDSGVEAQEEPEEEVPDDLFNIIVGHDKIKRIMSKTISQQEPLHILMHGPPATAKSLFLSELSRLPNSKYVIGSAVTKAGLTEYLLEYKPTYLILDEIEKADGEDLATLLSLMESGLVTRLKHKKRETEYLKTWVFASANKINGLPQELLSRFITYEVKPYDTEDIRKIAHRMLDNNLSDNVIDKIVDKVTLHSKDVRDVMKAARLVENEEEVDFVVSAIWG